MIYSDPVEIVAWRRINALLTTSGQPTEAQLPLLQGLGVTHVINLGLHSHAQALTDEGASLRRLGIDYVHIPVDFVQPAEADYLRFRDIMTALRDQTIHVHCIANMRVSAFLHRYRREQGEPALDSAVAMESIWRPGGVWARLIGDDTAADRGHLLAGKDYPAPGT